MNPVSLGVKAFERERETFSGKPPITRICQDGANMLFPYIVPEKKIKITVEEMLFLISNHTIRMEQLENSVGKAFIDMTRSVEFKDTFLAYCEDLRGRPDCIVVQSFRSSIAVMVGKEQREAFILRYK